MKVYLDNAATTPLDKEVFTAMTPYLLNHFGNPSSQHQFGREAKAAIDTCRQTIASLINAEPEEIIFTSGGTEADNTAILSAVKGAGINHVITTKFEHHAVLHTLAHLKKTGDISISFIKHDANGTLDLEHLEYLLQTNPPSLVSVMHANNEIGNLNDIARIGAVCEKYKALFHTDTVQTMGHYALDVQKLKVHYLAASAHKFHGPKGTGFLYCRKGTPLKQLIHGGGQERKLRAGTENIAGIVGLTTALQIACADINGHQTHILSLKNHMISGLLQAIPGISFNGNSADLHHSLYTVLSVSLPSTGLNLLRCLDEHGIAVSGGSACSAGASSHVLQALNADSNRDTIRFSFSKFNTVADINYAINILSSICEPVAA